jgi:signal transduction histidine kinase
MDAEDLELARFVAGHLALAISNARLLAQLGESLQQAKASSKRLEAVLNAAGVGLLVLDEHQELVAVNPEAQRALGPGLKPGKPLGKGKSSRSRLAKAVHDASEATNQGKNSRIETGTGDGLDSWLVSGTPIADLGSVITLQELTETVKAQAEMSRIRRLAEIGQMAAAIAHEIRNPLTGIKGAAHLVRDDPLQAPEFAQIVSDEVDKLNALCDGFLEFARPMRVSLRPVRLRDVVTTVVKSMKLEFGARDVRCDLRSKGAQPIIQADPLRLEQVVRNLSLNALQACMEGGRVTIETSGTTLTVRDNGSGMSREAKTNLFTPFFTTKPSGTGLGLSNVRKILDAHGATIEVRSRKGAGTTVRVKFTEDGGQ